MTFNAVVNIMEYIMKKDKMTNWPKNIFFNAPGPATVERMYLPYSAFSKAIKRTLNCSSIIAWQIKANKLQDMLFIVMD